MLPFMPVAAPFDALLCNSSNLFHCVWRIEVIESGIKCRDLSPSG